MLLEFATLDEWESGPYKRIKYVTNSRNQSEAAAYLDIRQSSISDAKKRLRIPAEWLWKIWLKTGTSPEWILTGRGPQFLVPSHSLKTMSAPQTNTENSLPHCYACPLEEKLLEAQQVIHDCLAMRQKLAEQYGPHVLWKPASPGTHLEKEIEEQA